MPGYTDEQHRKFYERTGKWHYSAPESLKKGPRTYTEKERAYMRQRAQSFGDLPVSGDTPYAGSGIARADSVILGNEHKPEKLTRPALAIQDTIASKVLEGDVEGAQKLAAGMKPPSSPTYTLREAVDSTGRKVFVHWNPKTKKMEKLDTAYAPVSSEEKTRTRGITEVSESHTAKASTQRDAANNVVTDRIEQFMAKNPKASEEQVTKERERIIKEDPMVASAKRNVAAHEDSVVIADNARAMGYNDFNQAAAHLKELETASAAYNTMAKTHGEAKAREMFLRENGATIGEVRNLIHSFRTKNPNTVR